MSVRAYRAAMGAGIAFVVLTFFGAGNIFGSTPNIKKHDTAMTDAAKWLAKLDKSSNRVQIVAGMFLVVLAAIALIWFTTAIRNRLAIGPTHPAGAFATLAAVGFAAIGVGPGSIAASNVLGNEPLPTDGEAVRFVYSQTYIFGLVIFGLAFAAFIVSVTLAAARSDAWPRWLVYYSWLAALGSVFAFIFLPIVLVLIWFLAVSIVGLVRGPGAPSAPNPTV